MTTNTQPFVFRCENDHTAANMRRIIGETDAAIAKVETEKQRFPGEESVFDAIIYLRRQYKAIAQRLLDVPARARAASERTR